MAGFLVFNPADHDACHAARQQRRSARKKGPSENQNKGWFRRTVLAAIRCRG
jgi:hypothetical protein